MVAKHVSRRSALKLGAATVALPLVHIRTAGAAGKLAVGFWDHWVPGGNDVMRGIVNTWGEANKVDVSMDFITSVGNKNLLTIAAESQAKSGHDMLAFPTWEVHNNARQLEPMDDVINRLTGQYGKLGNIVDYLSKVEGSYRAVPVSMGSQIKPCVIRISVFRKECGIDVKAMAPAADEMGPGYDDWNWEKFLTAAIACNKAGLPFGMPMGQFTDAVDWVGSLFRSYGAVLVNDKGDITVKSDNVRAALDYAKRLMPHLPADVYSWDDASNNRALISGKSALIMNPPSAWAVAVKDNPPVGEDCWVVPPPSGPQGRFSPYLPYFLGVWSFSKNKTSCRELIEFLSQREQVEKLTTAVHGYDVPPFPSMSNFGVWAKEGPPLGTLSNYPIKPGHKTTAWIAAAPAQPEVAVQIYNQATMTKMIARVAQGGKSIDDTIAWAQNELEGFAR